ncbi:UNVERIFIED_CONTAM: UDP-glucuronate 4-epimerase 3 [Sesamum radiatum]|uniref:UDP-glucuronate 4-epimerase 3 n=1 Tax=Sesamum radiatum TaxID=300843 RepID=A0AAW2KCG7_SESRA
MADRPPYVHRRWPNYSAPKFIFWASIFAALILFIILHSPPPDFSSDRRTTTTWGSLNWERRVQTSARTRSHSPSHSAGPGHLSVLVTGAAGFVGSHVSMALKRRGDGVVGLDNFNNYYDPSLKRARQKLLERAGVFVVEGDINDTALLNKLFDIVAFTHVMHLAAQAGVRYAMKNPASYVHSNIAGLVNLFEKKIETDQPASLYAATKKAGEEIAHTYNHIYGLSITGLRFFTVYGPWGRPDMAYFFFTKDI